MSRQHEGFGAEFGFDYHHRGRNEFAQPLGDRVPGKRTLTSTIFRSASSSAPQANDAEAIAARGFDGTPREVPHRPEMERAFGRSFADVRAFMDSRARESAGALHAHAYTVGNDIAFATESPDRRLVAHELAHVVQGQGTRSSPAPKAAVSTPADRHEAEADQVADRVAVGESVDGQTAVADHRVNTESLAGIPEIPSPSVPYLPYPSFALSGPAVSGFLREGGYARAFHEQLLRWPAAKGPRVGVQLATIAAERRRFAELQATEGRELSAAVDADVSSGAMADQLAKPEAFRAMVEYRYHVNEARGAMKTRTGETRSLAAAVKNLEQAMLGMAITTEDATKATLEEKKEDLEAEIEAAKEEAKGILDVVEKFVSIGVTVAGESFFPVLNDAASLFGQMLSTGQADVEAQLVSVRASIRRIRSSIHANRARQDAAAIAAAVELIKASHDKIAAAEAHIVSHIQMTMAKMTELRNIEAASRGRTTTFRETHDYQKKVAPQAQALLRHVEAALAALDRSADDPEVASMTRAGARTALGLDRDLVLRIFEDRRTDGDAPTTEQLSEFFVWLGNNALLTSWAERFFDWASATIRDLLALEDYLRSGRHLVPVTDAMNAATGTMDIPTVQPLETEARAVGP